MPSPRRRHLSGFIRPAAESLERRTLLTAYVVDTTDDALAADGKLSLREAILAANYDAPVYDAPAGQPDSPDAITFAPNLDGGTITLAGGELLITGDLTISGPGWTRLKIDADSRSRVFAIAPGADVAIGGLLITGGRTDGITPGPGGGILNLGSLTLTRAAVLENVALGGDGAGGGGIYNGGTLVLVDSVVNGNSADGNGGGVTVASNARTAVLRSSISGNTARLAGGGMFVSYDASANVDAGLVSGNFAQGSYGGGGILNRGDFAASNTTISGNVARWWSGGFAMIDSGAGTLRNVSVVGNRDQIDHYSSSYPVAGVRGPNRSDVPLLLHNTLVAGNTSGAAGFEVESDFYGGVDHRSSNNLIAGWTSLVTNGVNGNIVDVDWRTVVDPVLRYHGGTLPTHGLLSGSPALDAGANSQAINPSGSPLTTDQRGPGYLRIRGPRVDIGAWEGSQESDLVGFFGGEWYVAASTGESFVTSRWADWSGVAWDALRQGDFDGDGRTDVLGLRDGEWHVGLSDGESFGDDLWGWWQSVDWSDVLVGDFDGDGRDDIVANVDGEWWGAQSIGNGFGNPTRVAVTADASWDFAALADFDTDGRVDLVLNTDGVWYVGTADPFAPYTYPPGLLFGIPTPWGSWTDAPFQRLAVIDTNGPSAYGGAAVVGFLDGDWYAGISTGASLQTARIARFGAGPWADPLTGDFDGDGFEDFAARDLKGWHVALGGPTGPAAPGLWAGGIGLAWEDATVGDFDGDGRDDIAGRDHGAWYVARSTGTSFVTRLWGSWSDADWQAVAAGNVTTPPAAPTAGPHPAAPALAPPDEPLTAFWSRTEDDEDFARLLAAV